MRAKCHCHEATRRTLTLANQPGSLEATRRIPTLEALGEESEDWFLHVLLICLCSVEIYAISESQRSRTKNISIKHRLHYSLVFINFYNMAMTLNDKELCKLIKDSLRSSEAAEVLSFAIDQMPEIKAYLGQGLHPYYDQALPTTMRSIKCSIHKFPQLYQLNIEATDCQNTTETASIRRFFINWVVKILKYDCYDIMTKKYRINHGYGALVRASNKYLREALSELQESQVSQYLIVYSHLKKMADRLPRVNNVIQAPTSEQLIEIAKNCCKENDVNFSPQQVKEILEIGIKALENKQSYKEISLDQLLDHQIKDQEIEIPELPEEYLVSLDISSPQPLDNSRIISTLLGEVIKSLDDVLLILGYGFIGINQELIGTVFPTPISQYAVSRKLNKIRDNLQWQLKQEFLDKLPDHSQLDINILNDRFIKSLMIWYYRHEVFHEELEEWMRSHPESLSRITFLAGYFRYLPQEDAQKLRNYELTNCQLNQQIKITKKKLAQNLEEAALKLRTTEQELLRQVNSSTSEGVTYLSTWLSNQYNLSTDFLEEIKSNLEQTIYVFFANASYASLAFSNILSRQMFSDQWMPEEDIMIAFPEWKLARISRNKSRLYWARKINLNRRITNYSFGLLIGFEEEKKHKYFIQIRIYPSNGQKYLPSTLQMLVIDNKGSIFEQVEAKESDEWIQVGLRGELQEEFQVKVQIDQGSVTEKFII